jgi:hypothetical protein
MPMMALNYIAFKNSVFERLMALAIEISE